MRRLAFGACILIASVAFAASGLGPPTDIEFTATVDGSAERYVEMLPLGFDATQQHHVIMALHGHGSDRWQFVKQSRGTGNQARKIAAKHDLIFIAPDYRAKTSWMGPKAEADVIQIITELRAKYKVGKLFLVGGSMGGSSVLSFTAMHPDLVAGVCSCNGTANHLEYQNFQRYIQASFGGTKAQIPLEYKKRSAEYWPEAFTMPVAITASGKDTSVPPHSVMRLANVLKQMKRKVLLIYRAERGHNTAAVDAEAGLKFVVENALGIAPPEPKVEGGGIFFAGVKPESLSAKGNVELGLRFEITKPGTIRGVWLFQAERETGAHEFRLWAPDGKLLAKTKPTDPKAAGWHKVALDPPMPVKAGETYVVSYTANSRYVATPDVFPQPIVKPGITAHAGLYCFKPLGQMPTQTFKNMSYFLDVDYAEAR